MTPQRTKVLFDLNIPQLLTLEFDPPKDPRPGKFGEQFMYWLDGERTLWADPELHARIKATGAKAGNTVLIAKRKQKTQFGGYAVTWSVQSVSPQDLAKGHAALDAATPLQQSLEEEHHARPATRARVLPPAKPLDRILPAKKFAQPASFENHRTAPQLNAPRMTAALRAAMDACTETGFNNVATSEDIRCLAITIYIQESKR